MDSRFGTHEMIGSKLQDRNTTKEAETRCDVNFDSVLLHSKSTVEDTTTRKHPSEEDSGRQRFWWASALVVFSILDCFLLALLLTVSVDLARLQDSSSAIGVENVISNSTTATSAASAASAPGLLEDSAFCLPCSHVYLSEVEVLQNRSRVRQRKDDGPRQLGGEALLCCAEPHDDLKTLVGDMFIRIYYERDRARGVVKVTANDTDDDDDEEDDQSDVIKPHILLQLDREAEPKEVNGTHALPLKLSKREAPSHHNQTSAFLLEGVVKIAHPGHFYIHSLVPFTYHLDQPVILTQYVYRVRNGGETLLLENSVYPCDVSVQHCEHSFVGGLFLLEREDEVVLRVSNHSYVAKDRDMEFGVHRL